MNKAELFVPHHGFLTLPIQSMYYNRIHAYFLASNHVLPSKYLAVPKTLYSFSLYLTYVARQATAYKITQPRAGLLIKIRFK